MIITIDGPAGAGKSSAARLLAQRLGCGYLDTGAMYRAVTLAGLHAHVDFDNPNALAAFLAEVKLSVTPGGVCVDGKDVSNEIRTAEVSNLAGRVAAIPKVRSFLVQLQRAVANERDYVCEGRDQGTIVFPQALCKFFLIADPHERARRRHREMHARGDRVPLEEVVRDQTSRDQRDAGRDIAPMQPAPDAIILDSTHLALEVVVDRMEAEVRKRLAAGSEELA